MRLLPKTLCKMADTELSDRVNVGIHSSSTVDDNCCVC